MSYFIEIGVAFDMMLNAILGGQAGQTLSYRAAVAQSRRELWGCLFCHFLAWLVQPQHCIDQLTGTGMKQAQYVRAFLGLAVLAGILLAAMAFPLQCFVEAI